MTTQAMVMDAAGRVRKQSDLPGATDPIVFYMGRAQPLSVAGVLIGATDPMVVDDTVPERVRRYSQTDEASTPPPPPPPPATAWNPADKAADITLTNSDLTATNTGSGWKQVRSVAPVDHFKVTVDAIGAFVCVGVCNTSLAMDGFWAGSTDVVFAAKDGAIYYNFPSSLGSTGGFTTGDVIEIARGSTSGTIKIKKNAGAFSGDYAVPGIGADFYAVVSLLDAGAVVTADFT